MLLDQMIIEPFTNVKLIGPEFYFHTEQEVMDELIGIFSFDNLICPDKLAGYISYSLNDATKEINIAFIESLTKSIGIGEALLTYFMTECYKTGYSIETMVCTQEGKDFFDRMLKKNILPVGTRVISLV